MIPTGYPNIPTTVQEMNEIRDSNIEKTERATGSEEEMFSPDDFYADDNTNEQVDVASRGGKKHNVIILYPLKKSDHKIVESTDIANKGV